jgi:hypothetical protein
MAFNEETKTCDEVHIFGKEYPLYSYVYTYENKTTTGNITYPEYNITTTMHTGNEDYTEQPENTCPCDLGEFATGEKEINEIIKVAVDSAVEQQAKADYDFYTPLLPDPTVVPEVEDPSIKFVEEKDDIGTQFLNMDGTIAAFDYNGPVTA